MQNIWPLLLAYLAVANLGAFAAFARDKRAAVLGHRRTPERALLWWALAGGAVGAVAAQQLLRHKTRKQPFATLLWVILVVEAALVWIVAAL